MQTNKSISIKLVQEWTWGVMLQFASAASTIFVVMAVARASTASDFARFSVTVLAYQLFQTMSRATVGVLLGQGSPSAIFALQSAWITLRLHLGQTLGLVAVIVCTQLFYRTDQLAVAIGYGITAVLAFQLEYLRSSFAAAREPAVAARVDLAVAGTFAMGYGAGLVLGVPLSSIVAVLLWFMAVCMGICYALYSTKKMDSPSVKQAPKVSEGNVRYLLLDWMATAMRFLLPTYWLVLILTGPTLAGYRGAFLFVGVGQRFARGVIELLLPQLGQIRSDSDRHRTMWVAGFAVLVFLLIATVFFAGLPDSIGRQLLGESWTETALLLPWLYLSLVLRVPELIASVGLLANRQNRKVSSVRWTVGIVEFAFVLIAATVMDARGLGFAHMAGGAAGSMLMVRAFVGRIAMTKQMT